MDAIVSMTQLSSLTHFSRDTSKMVIGSVDPDQNAGSDQGLHCLQIDLSFFSRNI